jgi:hypothetical protein
MTPIPIGWEAGRGLRISLDAAAKIKVSVSAKK